MPPLRIPIDGLWRCLCPSIDIIALSYPAPRKILSHNTKLRPRLDNKPPQLRSRAFASSSKAQVADADRDLENALFIFDTPNKSKLEPSIRYLNGVRNTIKYTEPKPWDHWNNIPVNVLYDQLRKLRTEKGAFHKVVDLVDYLIRVRGEKPSLEHYDALMQANSDAENGSVKSVRALLKEMKDAGIGANVGFYHSALQALAIHPDYLLRNDVMQAMKERWFGLSPEGWHNLVIGLLRDNQLEIAMDKLEQMHSDGLSVQPWLYDIYMFKLCEFGELDEVFKLLVYRFTHVQKDIAPTIWYYLLDKFSSDYHYKATHYIWKLRVENGYINPSDGICLNVLNVAARYADPIMATSATRFLSSRRTALAPFHYEALLAAYAGADDLNTAFRILGIMYKAGFDPDASATRPILQILAQSKNRGKPLEAWELLKNQFRNGHMVHIAAVNVVLEAAVANHCFQDAIRMYKELHVICEQGPNTETFNNLMQGAERMHAKDTAMFLAAEMAALNIQPDHLTYDRLIMVCLNEEDYEDAFNYLEEMINVGKDKFVDGVKGWWMRCGTAAAIVKKCSRTGDKRGDEILAEIGRRGERDSKWRVWEGRIRRDLEAGRTIVKPPGIWRPY